MRKAEEIACLLFLAAFQALAKRQLHVAWLRMQVLSIILRIDTIEQAIRDADVLSRDMGCSGCLVA